MKKVLLIAIGAVLICLSCGLFDRGETDPPKEAEEENIVARVNGVGITRHALVFVNDRLNMQESTQQGTNVVSPAEKESNRKKALDLLIRDELAWQKAKAEGLKAEPSEVEKGLAAFKTKLGDEAFRQMMEREQLTEEALRTRIERGIVIQLIFNKEVVEVSSKVPVSENDLKKEYEKEKAMFIMPEKVEVTEVVFFLEPEETQSVKIAEGVLAALLADKGRDPHNLAADWGYAVYDTEVKKQKDPEIYREAKKLKLDEISGVIKTRDSLQIIKLKSYSPETQVPFEKAEGYLESNLKAEALRNRAQEWETELRKDARIEILDTVGGKK